MNKDVVVVGLNAGHNGGCAIIVNGQVVCAIAEERLNRQRYSTGYQNALIYCLKNANISISRVDLFVFSTYGPRLPENYTGDLASLGIDPNICITIDHHLSHACGSFLTSPFKKSLIAIFDGQGNDFMTESFYIGEDSKINKIEQNDLKRAPSKGIGRTYESFTNFIGWTDDEAGKTMGLAAYGDSEYCKIPLFEINGLKVESLLEYTHEQGVINFMNKHGVDFGKLFGKGETELSKNAAAYVQKQTEDAILVLIKNLITKTGIKNLCIGGGVALNCLTNTRLQDEAGLDNIYVLPASSDQGQALGNATYGYYYLTNQTEHISIKNDYLGKVYTEKEILNALTRHPWYITNKIIPNNKFEYTKLKNVSKLTAKLIASGNIVGWFQGGSELGPRALGNRSILADPRFLSTREELNNKIKQREEFRPFAPSILIDDYSDWFDINTVSPFMLFAPKAKKELSHLIPAVIHEDGTSRVQTVSQEQNQIFYDLINEYKNITNIPILLNTSFNCNEPIVETPSNALSTFLSTSMDFLVMGDYLVSKTHQ